MTLDQLKYFQTAAETLHIGKAAKIISISQPSLSISLRKLESELGVPLFQPSGRGIALTSYGKEFLPYTRSILQQAEAAKNHMKQKADRLNQEIRITYTSSVSYRFIPRLLRDFTAECKKEYLIYSDERPSQEIADGLKAGHFDLGICSKIESDPDIRQISILYQPLVLILPKTGKYSDISSESPQSICSAPFVSYRSDFPMYRQISALFARYDLSPQITHFAYSEDAIEQLVAQNLGISIVAETESLELYDNIQVLRPSWLNDGRYLYLTYHTLRHQGNGVKEMISYIRKTFVKD